MPGEPVLFVVNVDTRSLMVQVRVNDITVYNNHGTQAMFAEKINPLMVPQANSLTVSLALPLPPPAAPNSDTPPADPPDFRLTVQRGEYGADPGEAGVLLRYRWSQGQAPLTTTLVEVFRGSFDAGAISWHPRWSSLPPVGASNDELARFVLRFADYLRARDVDRLLALYALKFRELSAALGLDAAQMTASFRDYLRRIMEGPAWNVAPLNVGLLRYSPEAGGRMVRIALDTGEPPIMTRGPAGEIPFGLTVVRVDGELQIIR